MQSNKESTKARKYRVREIKDSYTDSLYFKSLNGMEENTVTFVATKKIW